MDKYLAIDIGGTFIKYGIIKENAEILKKGKKPTPSTLEELLEIVEELKEIDKGITGIAVSAPGAVGEDGIIYGTSAIPYLHGPNVKDLIIAHTNLPVYMENDANCAAYAEVWKGAAKGKENVLAVVIGTGIGGAVIKNGELHKGANLHGGEFGYMLMHPEIDKEGNTWSWAASTLALVQKVADLKGVNKHELSGEYIFELAEDGDVICQKAIEEFYHLLAFGIYNLQYMYDPELILIGGGISAREDLIKEINHKIDNILKKVNPGGIVPVLATCEFRQDSNLLGAVYGFMKHVRILLTENKEELNEEAI